jgi:hypothetical protein
MIRALRSGILVLVFPPLGISVALTVLSYRKRNQFSHHGDSDNDS